LTLNTFADEQLRAFSEQSRYLYKAEQPLTLTANVAEYDITGLSGSTYAFCDIDAVIIDNMVLANENGQPGPISMEALMRATAGAMYSTAASTPQCWIKQLPLTIRLWPKPDAATAAKSTHYVNGYYYHAISPTLNDNSVLTFPDEVCRLLCKFAALPLIEPYASGDGYAKYQSLRAEVMSELEALKVKGQEIQRVPRVRGFNERNVLNLMNNG
jgi:hypothetical protein